MIVLNVALNGASKSEKEDLKRMLAEHFQIREIVPKPGEIRASLDWHVLLNDTRNASEIGVILWCVYKHFFKANQPIDRFIMMLRDELYRDCENIAIDRENPPTRDEFVKRFDSAVSRIRNAGNQEHRNQD
jgi:hypothetical protein